MGNPNTLLPPPQSSSPIELELLALHELAVHPEALQLQLLMLGGLALSSAIQSAIEEPNLN